MEIVTERQELQAYLAPLVALPFVRRITLESPVRTASNQGLDGEMNIVTPKKHYKLALELKRTFLDRTLTNAIIARSQLLKKQQGLPLLLVARYIPRPTGERLAEAGVNFVDRAGNINLKLGVDYYTFILGRKEAQPALANRRLTPALVQLSFALLAEPDSVTWPVRRLAEAAGIGKTVAAQLRQRLLQNGTIAPVTKGRYRIANVKKIQEEFVAGYGQSLRPHILIGTFRPRQSDPRLFLQQFAATAKHNELHWALTGGPAGYVVERYYRGDQTPIFIERMTPELQRALELLPDPHGPVIFLRAFSRTITWRTAHNVPIAHPWLIYAELLYQGDARALQASEEIREKYLSE
jgi:hypothetical protein